MLLESLIIIILVRYHHIAANALDQPSIYFINDNCISVKIGIAKQLNQYYV